MRGQGRLDAPDRLSASARSARSRSSAPTCRSPCGTALAAQTLGTGAVSLCFFGDGSTNIGAFHEAMNLASVWKLAGSCSSARTTSTASTRRSRRRPPVERLADRAAAYAMPGRAGRRQRRRWRCAPPSPRPASARAAGDGPTFLEALTYRHMGHSRSDPGAYRPEGELEQLARARSDHAASSSALDGRRGRASRPGRRPRGCPAGGRRRRRRGRSPGPSRSPTTASRACGRRRDERASPTARP